ncbi:MAG TPA: aquaporin [Chitinophagaceae bacterium]|nr:aquaporin [Chitinophagaceae bacterium]
MSKVLTEFIGTFFLVMGAALGGGIGASLALVVMVYAGGHISGAHYNPAVSLAVWMRGRLSLADMISYWMSQIAGCLLAAVVVSNIFSTEGAADCVIPEDGIITGLIAELIGTFALAYVVLSVATAKGTAGNSFYGLAIGGTVLAMATVIGKFSGGAYNPAVAIGLCFQKTLCWSQLWIYLSGSIAGAALAAITFKKINADDK